MRGRDEQAGPGPAGDRVQREVLGPVVGQGQTGPDPGHDRGGRHRLAPGGGHAERRANSPSGTAMKPSMAKKWAATQAGEDMDAVAPSTVDSSCHGRIAG